eukprot:3822623-Amphidinium_carterae.1
MLSPQDLRSHWATRERHASVSSQSKTACSTRKKEHVKVCVPTSVPDALRSFPQDVKDVNLLRKRRTWELSSVCLRLPQELLPDRYPHKTIIIQNNSFSLSGPLVMIFQHQEKGLFQSHRKQAQTPKNCLDKRLLLNNPFIATN